MSQDAPAPPACSVAPACPRSLAHQGDAGDVNAWSGTAYFLFQAGRRAGFLTHTLNTTDPHYRRNRLVWNALSPLRLERPGGYQFSPGAVRRMWRRVPPDLRRGEIVSHFQVFPPADLARREGVRHSWYGDATLRQLFYDQPGADVIGRRTAADALARETDMYHAARFVVAMASETAWRLTGEYGIDPAKVFVARPGANLDEAAVDQYLTARGPSWRERAGGAGTSAAGPFTPDHPARLGFIGRDYVRKGLPRLVEAAEVLHRRGRPVRVTVIGHCPEHLRTHPRVEWVGLVDKAREMGRFLAEVDRFAIGCLPSHYEPLGIGTLECLRLGVPVMGTRVGGIPDCVPAEGGILLDADVAGEQIADALEPHLFDPDRYCRLVEGAVREMPNVTWDRTVRRLIDIWEGRVRPEASVP